MRSGQHHIAKKLLEREEAGNYRRLKTGTELIDFSSNDYLGFARSAKLRQMIDEELQRQSSPINGSTGSRLITGNSVYAELLEKQIASIHNAEACLLINSGYDANLGLFSSLPQRGDTVIADELIHASVIDGIRLSNANRYSFKHNDLSSLEGKLKASKGTVYIAVESIYSMDGDAAPINEILALAERYDANLIVDEAHALGVFGFGLANDEALSGRVFARVITYGKALGCHGAAVIGSSSLREYLINFARSFIYTTAAPLHQSAAIKVGYEFLAKGQHSVDKLQADIKRFKSTLKLNDPSLLISSNSAIQCVLMKGNQKARHIADQLQQSGFDVRPIMSPTVAPGSERLRICLHAFNTDDEIKGLTTALNLLINEYN